MLRTYARDVLLRWHLKLLWLFESLQSSPMNYGSTFVVESRGLHPRDLRGSFQIQNDSNSRFGPIIGRNRLKQKCPCFSACSYASGIAVQVPFIRPLTELQYERRAIVRGVDRNLLLVAPTGSESPL